MRGNRPFPTSVPKYVHIVAKLTKAEAEALAKSSSFGVQVRFSNDAEVFLGAAAVSTSGGNETQPLRAMLNDLLQLTEQVNELVDLAGYIIHSSRSVYRDFSDIAERETKALYAVLPALSGLE